MKHNKEELTIKIGTYNNGRKAIQLLTKEGMPYAVATINIPDADLKEDEVIIKNYSENQGILEMLIENDIVVNTYREIKTGMVSVPVCKLLID